MFKEGDRVALKSGGPIMTVEDKDEDSCTCIWFNDKDEIQTRTFMDATLKNVEDN